MHRLVMSAAIFGAVVLGEELKGEFPEDECAIGDEGCAFHALQVHAQKDAPTEESPISPALQADVEGLFVEELGDSELAELHAKVQGEIQRRAEGAQQEQQEQRMEPVIALEANASRMDPYCTSRSFTGNRWGTEMCFCELAHNGACAGGCHCPQGCQGVTWEHPLTVSFKNKARASGYPSTVILTSPKGYFRDVTDLKATGQCTVEIINNLLVDGFNTYQQHVRRQAVWQCFHGSHTASVKYLHLQTFNAWANFHGMPTHNHNVAVCEKMHHVSESWQVAQRLAAKM